MITPAFGLTATERVLPRLALDFTTASLDPRVTFIRTTGALNPATYINSSGVITAATNNQPRFDYDPVTLVCKGLLIEESRTNSLLNTDLLSTQIVTVTAAARTLSFYGTGSVTFSGTHTAVVSGTGAYPTRTTYTFTPTAGALTLTVTGTVQYAQLEAGAFATSYIPTTTAALTRNADFAAMTGANFTDWYNATEGTLLVQSDFLSLQATTQVVASINNSASASSNTITLIKYGAATEFYVVNGGALQAEIAPSGSVVVNTMYGQSGGYKANAFVAARNGGAVVQDTSGTIPTVDRLVIGSYFANSSCLNGHVAKLSYYNLRLTNNEVRAISK